MTRSLSVAVGITFLVVAVAPTGSGGDDTHRRRWPKSTCDARPGDRPTVLSAWFDARRDNVHWRYKEAHDALVAGGVSTEVLERNGPRRWDQFAQAGGTARKLVPAGRRLRNYEPPRRLLRPPDVFFECAGHGENLPTFFVNIPRNIHARTIVDRHGGRERNLRRLFAYENTRWWSMKRRQGSGIVQRMLSYLSDPDVFVVEMNTKGFSTQDCC